MTKLSILLTTLLTALLFSTHLIAGPKHCSSTARTMAIACTFDSIDDYYEKRANCINISDRGDRRECFSEQREDYREARDECSDQKDARLDLCDLVGEGRYDPEIDPDNFVDPLLIGNGVTPNTYFPLVPGNRWVYIDEDGGESIVVVVTEKTKLIEGVTAIVVNDIVREWDEDLDDLEDGALIEDTDDWYAQDLDGNVWYFGEIAKNYESFEGDDPEEAELTDIDGSFKAGVEHAKPGILMRAVPQVGDVQQQEYALGNAEDVSEVVSTTASESVSDGAFSCSSTCLETLDYTPLEPGVFESKFYAPGIGVMLETDDEGARVELVEFDNVAE